MPVAQKTSDFNKSVPIGMFSSLRIIGFQSAWASFYSLGEMIGSKNIDTSDEPIFD